MGVQPWFHDTDFILRGSGLAHRFPAEGYPLNVSRKRSFPKQGSHFWGTTLGLGRLSSLQA